MDICNTLKCITNLNEYISATQDILNKCPEPKIQFNMSTVLAMKRIRCLEIEYFNKCEENGAAFIVFEQILRLPPSKTWGLLGVELISLVQYWLDALRKHLIFHNNHWWQFLNALLSFIEKIRLKSTSIRNVLVQETAECLLDLATNDKPDISQRYKIINCFNSCCADCSREIRISMRKEFTGYFTRLAHEMAACGDARTQLAGLEALLRWLLPRQDQQLRQRAAADWFPPQLYPPRCRDIFLERRWQNFSQDARDFLNALNEGGERVLSARCTRLTVGGAELISEQDEKEYWLDINTGSRSVSLMLEPKQLEGLDGSSSDVLLIGEDNVEKLHLQGGGDSCVLRAWLAPPARPVCAALARPPAAVRRALRAALPDTHMIVTDINSPNKNKEKPQYSDTDAKDQTEPATDARGTSRSGYIVRPRVPVSWQSPSTASTSSLAMLRDKLSAFSGFIFDKEPVSVCAVPQLSNVTELSESEEQRQFNSLSTLKLRPYGVCSKNRNKTESKRDKSDESVSETAKKCISPVVEDEESSVSCLLVATIGSANDSVINDTLDRLPKDKDIHTDNIVDLLAKEALQYKQTSEVVDEAIQVNTRDKNVLEEIPCDSNVTNVVEITKKDKKKPTFPKKQTVISNTTTDESNIDYVEDTPDCANKKKIKITKNNLDYSNKENFDNLIGLNQNFDNRDVENFFSQHINENCNRELVISPTLAQKINRSSSESSTDFDLLPHIIDNDFSINDIEIIECLNEMVDKVCKDLEKCTEYLGQDLNVFEQFNKEAGISNQSSRNTSNTNLNKMDETDKDHTFSSQRSKSIKSFKLKFNPRNIKVTRNKTKNKKKIELEPIVETSQITENDNTIDNEHDINHYNPKTSNEPDEFKTPLIRRRRKLYSPKDDHVTNKEVSETTVLGSNKKITEESKPQQTDINQNKTSTPYKEIEKLRKNRILRNKSRKAESPLSPRSKKLNDMFDNLKNTIEGDKDIILAKRNTRNKGAIYNFPTDSDDEDFKEVEIPKKSSKTTTNNSTAKSTGRRKLLKVEKPAPATNKRKNKRNTQRSTKKFSEEDLEKPQTRFEQMRNAPPEALEVSFVAEVHELENIDPDPVIAVLPTMETECTGQLNENVPKQRKKKNVRNEIQSKETTNKLIIIEDKPEDKDITVSPLPGLVIETMPLKDDGKKDSISTCMLDGLNDITDDKHMSLLNNTHNLISDIEEVPDMQLRVYNIDDEVSVAASNDSKVKRNKFNLSTRKHKKSQKIKKEINKRNSKSSPKQSKKTVNLSSDSEKSIVTAGKSPITAHGDFNEAPPSFRQLNQRITEQRGIEVNDVNDTLQDYFKNLNKDINTSSDKSNSSSNAKFIKDQPKKGTTVSNLSPAVTITRLSLSDIGKWIPPRYNSVFGSDESSSSSVTTKRKISTRASIHREKSADVESVKDIRKSENNEKMRLSAISPIKLFDDFQIDGGESIQSPKVSIKNCQQKNVQGNSEASSHRYELRCKRNLKHGNKKTKSKNSLTSVEESEDSRVPSVKRKSPTITGSPKRQKVSDTRPSIVQSASVPSVSSVEVWMAENIDKQTPATTENLDQSLKDSVEIVLEKLDTTLLEIHHNTSKKFVNMFLGVQKRLADMREERRRMYRAGGRELLADIVKLIDRKFLDLDHRSLEMDDQFMSSLREEARGLLREDCRQKRTMVALLRQDVQAARDHCDRAGQLDLLLGSKGVV